MTPVGLPVLTMMPSRTVKVFGATCTGIQPFRSRPLKRGTQSFSAAVAERRKRKNESNFKCVMGAEYQRTRCDTRQNEGEKREIFFGRVCSHKRGNPWPLPVEKSGQAAVYSRGAFGGV